MSHPIFSAVIPAYNEADTIASVVKVFAAMPDCTEVIVVDDGSSDDTSERARKAGARVIRQDNQGKGVAMHTGVRAAKGHLIFFSDADLVGLSSRQVACLIAPVANGRAAMTVGLRDRGAFLTRILPRIAPVLGGERVMARELFLALSGSAVRDFGIETVMNAYCAKKRLPVEYIPMWGVSQIIKERKYGIWRGFLARLRMVFQILRAEIMAYYIR